MTSRVASDSLVTQCAAERQRGQIDGLPSQLQLSGSFCIYFRFREKRATDVRVSSASLFFCPGEVSVFSLCVVLCVMIKRGFSRERAILRGFGHEYRFLEGRACVLAGCRAGFVFLVRDLFGWMCAGDAFVE